MVRRSDRSKPGQRSVPGQAHARPVTSPNRRRSRRRSKTMGWLTRLVLVTGLFAILGVSGWLVSIARDLPDTAGLADVERAASITFLDRQGQFIARRGSAHGRLASIEELPPYMIDAVLAVEDRRFYSHPGVDVIGTSRALLANLLAGRVVQGGSTLTQQLAKNLFLTPERTLRRKVQEMMLAFWLEGQYSKDEILELYLNRVYFGGGAWGIEAAATRYFGKSASEVTLGEAALLAGLLKAPSRYNPTNDANRAAARATVVIDLMAQTGRITNAERIQAASAPIRISSRSSSPGAQYFVDWQAQRVRELLGPDHGDLVVHTTLDVDAQRAAEDAMTQILENPETAAGASEGALVSLAHDGAVRAMVGGLSYTRSQFNRAILASRQPGSAFKAFVYASAFEAGLNPDDRRLDAPVQIGDWSPQNYNNEYRGEMSLREAFYRSSNSVAVRIAEETGRGHIARLAERLGIESTLLVDRSLALGAYEVTPLEMATAYVPFANGGNRALTYGITWIESPEGEGFYQAPPGTGQRVLDARTYGRMHDLFRTVVRQGTGRRANVSGLVVGGKTGTTNDFRDAWFAGFAGDLVTVVWVGNDNNEPTDRATGGGPPARIFNAFMTAAPRSGLASEPHVPQTVVAEEPAVEVIEEAETPEATDAIGAFLAGLSGD
jgi:penicillin-binding protein 1A